MDPKTGGVKKMPLSCHMCTLNALQNLSSFVDISISTCLEMRHSHGPLYFVAEFWLALFQMEIIISSPKNSEGVHDHDHGKGEHLTIFFDNFDEDFTLTASTGEVPFHLGQPALDVSCDTGAASADNSSADDYNDNAVRTSGGLLPVGARRDVTSVL